MKNRFIPAFIMLTAGLICSLISILNHWEIIHSLVTLLLVLLIFYCLGSVGEYIIRKVQEKNTEDRLEEERQEKIRLEKERMEEEVKEKENEEEEQLDEGETEKDEE